ncbi:uncharacterized protein LOC121408339 [Lytechinus variegatus]|uniref:uncharacterized protein LOC121408339 n=1 Tax=Lytechinus variegatus TaxID=7654 RepID=UPI001BB26655|nr:uncharacterized protein LOC121408339 [Lytechinus variegatus]
MALVQSVKKRFRTYDYSEEEIQIIKSGSIKHSTTLSAKHSNDATQRIKDNMYDSIRLEVNALGVAERSLQSIKDKWQALKKNVKEKVAAGTRLQGKEREKTGGENPTLDDPDVFDCLNDDEKEILQVIPSEQITGRGISFT